MTKAKKYIPEGLRSITTHLVVPNALEAIEFYKTVFGAVLESHAPGATPNSTMHAALKIGDAALFLADEMPQSKAKSPENLGGTTNSLMLYVSDVDAVAKKAVESGAKLARPVEDKFYGDRMGSIEDPFGHTWHIATHIEDVSPDEMQKRAASVMAAGQ